MLLARRTAIAPHGGGNGLLNHLIAYYELEEASGNRVDQVNAFNLTPNGSPLPGNATGKIGNAVALIQADSQYLSVASNSTLQTGNVDFTWTGWVYLSTNVSGVASCKFPNSNADNEWVITYLSGSQELQVVWYTNATGTFTTVTATNFGALSLTTFYFVAMQHDAANNVLSLSINNTTPNTGAANGGNTGTAAFVIGARSNGAVSWNGRIDEVGLWKSAAGAGGLLTATQITALFNGGSGLAFSSFTH